MLHSNKIVLLPEVVINQIAAGEVVENPSSIVKELIENSLDAGAHQISVVIRNGGQLLIEVEDDGCGMNPEDAILCLQRHATSKIRSAEDLHALVTMGFRGEALAAIAAVSLFELRTSEGEVGTSVRVKGGVIEEIVPCARNRGTTMSVRSLFFNVPARKKFQKSSASSTAQVTKIVEIISCAHPEVSFSLTSQDAVVFSVPPQSKKERIEAVFGPFSHVVEEPFIWGLLSSPQEAKSQRRGQVLFMNKRAVFSPLIAKAVQMGYGTRLAENMYPPFVLFLEIDPADLDVNVHPQKKEVRLSNESVLFRRVESTIAKMFAPSSFSLNSSFISPLEFTPPPAYSFAEERSFCAPTSLQEVSLPFEMPERPLAILGKYLLLEKEGWLLIDLSCAHARILFEELKENKGERQSLLWPLEADIDDPEEMGSLQKMGISCRLIGEKRIAVDALPVSIGPTDFSSFFESWKKNRKEDAIAVSFCRNLKKRYSIEEGIDLWRRLQICRDSIYDPLGRKIWAKILPADLDLWVSRG